MAAGPGVLERSERRAYLDDTIPLIASILTHRVIPKQNFVEYVIKVQRGPSPEDCWEVSHRYSDFTALATILQASGLPLHLPPKKVFGTTDRQFITERQLGLDAFLLAILSEPILSNHIEVKKFLDPKNYSTNFYENALRNVSMFFRSEPTWNVVGSEPLKDIGWRIRKQYYLISNKDPKLSRHLLTWCEPGPDFSLGTKEMEACLKLLTDLYHPFILSPALTNFSGTGLMTVRPYMPSGSLRDAIYGKSPKSSTILKYSQPAKVVRLTTVQIQQYGRQVLEALNFLAEKGFVLGHIHAGNVLLCGDTCKLVDIENSLMGLPSPYRCYLVELKKLRSHMGETVYSFGHMLYEMCAGYPLKKALIEDKYCPRGFQPDAARIIESILTSQAIKDGLPSISDLLGDQFFREACGVPANGEKPRLRVPSKLREVLRGHLERMEQRLLTNQKKLAQHRRISKAQENVLSEDEKKKRRKLRKKQLSLQEEAVQEAYPTTNSLTRQTSVGTSGVPARDHIKKQSTSAVTSTPTINGTSHSSCSSSCASIGSSHNSNSSNSKNTPSKTKIMPTKAPSPASSDSTESRPAGNNERVVLLGSIESFKKGKLKKTITNDRSGILIR